LQAFNELWQRLTLASSWWLFVTGHLIDRCPDRLVELLKALLGCELRIVREVKRIYIEPHNRGGNLTILTKVKCKS